MKGYVSIHVNCYLFVKAATKVCRFYPKDMMCQVCWKLFPKLPHISFVVLQWAGIGRIPFKRQPGSKKFLGSSFASKKRQLGHCRVVSNRFSMMDTEFERGKTSKRDIRPQGSSAFFTMQIRMRRRKSNHHMQASGGAFIMRAGRSRNRTGSAFEQRQRIA